MAMPLGGIQWEPGGQLMDLPPKISVIIAARNAAATLAKCLTSLTAQERVSFEIIVVDDESSDDTRAIARSFENVAVVELGWGGPSRARNVGVARSRGDLVAFTDADCVAHPDWLPELARCFDDPSVAGAGGDQGSPEDDTVFGKRVQELFKTIGFMTDYIKSDASGKTIRETTHNPSCNSAYRKQLFEHVGGFSEDQFPGEDLELDLKLRRLGHKLVYNPAAVVGHYRPASYRALASMMRRYGAGERKLVRKFGFLRLLDYQPFVLLLLVMTLGAALTWHPDRWLWLAVPCLVPFAWFLRKTSRVGKSLQFSLMLGIVIINWNWGFIRGDRKSNGRLRGSPPSPPHTSLSPSAPDPPDQPPVTWPSKQESGS
jgi:cellulose synthase/poly-beta-1,6-N-acetylglucosamine synthase-like glycosyltransferase